MKRTKFLYPQTQDTQYTQIEHSIIAEFFESILLEESSKIPPLAYADSNEENGIVPLSDHHGEIGEHCLSNAVARIILDGLQKMLTNFRYYENESEVSSRKDHSLRKSKLHLRPMHLLSYQLGLQRTWNCVARTVPLMLCPNLWKICSNCVP